MGKKYNTWRGDIMRRIAEIEAKLGELRRNALLSDQHAKRLKQVEQELADLKERLLR
jgi:hypothetical protein